MTDFVKPTSVREVFLRAANLIEEQGHSKNNWVGPSGEVCLSEALCRSALGEGVMEDWKEHKPGDDPLLNEACSKLCPEGNLENFQNAVCKLNNKFDTTGLSLVRQLRELADTA